MSCIAFIPARSGSSRIPHKNVCNFFGHPLIAYSINQAIHTGIFSEVVVITDSPDYADIAQSYGASVPDLRPSSTARNRSTDCEWLEWILNLNSTYQSSKFFSILRPTSPFRSVESIVNAFNTLDSSKFDSIRAVEPVKQHPGKMWRLRGEQLLPLFPFEFDEPNNVPWHNSSFQSLPNIYIQNASLEICRTISFFKSGIISGESVMPLFTTSREGFDINYPEDILYAEFMVYSGRWAAPPFID